MNNVPTKRNLLKAGASAYGSIVLLQCGKNLKFYSECIYLHRISAGMITFGI